MWSDTCGRSERNHAPVNCHSPLPPQSLERQPQMRPPPHSRGRSLARREALAVQRGDHTPQGGVQRPRLVRLALRPARVELDVGAGSRVASRDVQAVALGRVDDLAALEPELHVGGRGRPRRRAGLQSHGREAAGRVGPADAEAERRVGLERHGAARVEGPLHGGGPSAGRVGVDAGVGDHVRSGHRVGARLEGLSAALGVVAAAGIGAGRDGAAQQPVSNGSVAIDERWVACLHGGVVPPEGTQRHRGARPHDAVDRRGEGLVHGGGKQRVAGRGRACRGPALLNDARVVGPDGGLASQHQGQLLARQAGRDIAPHAGVRL
mmetsp:Transcript_4276/g.18091  ORF Transcript_4276/g.18091 Transcript_4276/m.18091 type:complete len:322 (+) Transcript_4276:895-1860(+)